MKLYPSKMKRVLAIAIVCISAFSLEQSSLRAAPGYTPTRNVDDGIVNPFATELAWFSGTSGGFNETSSYTVPADKRLEIEEISCQAYAPSSTEVMMKITFTAGGITLNHFITGFSSSQIFGNYWFLGLTSHHIFVDPGTTITIDVIRQAPAGASIGYYSDVILSGRMTSL